MPAIQKAIGALAIMIGMTTHAWAQASDATDRTASVDFSRDIQPILAAKCLKCHGADELNRQAELRLDKRDSAVATKAIVPGDSRASMLVARINESDQSKRMPPADSKQTLSPRERQLLSQWIDQGAQYSAHWAFTPIKRLSLPAQRASWGRNAIDLFVHDSMLDTGFRPAQQADPATLLRRVSLDLTGLPPTLLQLDQFLADQSGNAYERAVDRLLDSPAYAERMALDWLDAARYADTNGYNNDEDRTMWPWRNWVIEAFQANMPYDQFIVQQIAGDLLPAATTSQLLATAFNRNLGHNTEGGIIQEEYRVEYVADRVHTTATVFLGLSLQCARCHDHKYDPITQREYYQFYAFFNQMEEKQASYNKFRAAEPMLTLPSRSEQMELDLLDQRIASCRATVSRCENEASELFQEWFQRHSISELQQRVGTGLIHHVSFDAADAASCVSDLGTKTVGQLIGKTSSVGGKFGEAIELSGDGCAKFENVANFDGSRPFSLGVWIKPQATDTMAIVSRIDESKNMRGFELTLEGEKLTCQLIHSWPEKAIKIASKAKVKTDVWQYALLTYDGSRSAKGVRLYLDGQTVEIDSLSDSLTDSIATDKALLVGRRETSLGFRGLIDELQVFDFVLSGREIALLTAGNRIPNILELASMPRETRTDQENSLLETVYLERIDTLYSKAQQQLDQSLRERQALESKLTAVMIMRDTSNIRQTFVLKRGQYDQPAEKVDVGIPAALPQLQDQHPKNRLGLAQWMIARENPLVARVAVNRWWQMLFGTGLVKTAEDFGITGQPPSHPELLDFLATELIDSGWNVKAILKQMVMSATYRQSSRITADSLERDPENRWLARGARYRLSAETMRDNALAIAGLLSSKVGGPSVKPYQPDGLWEDVTVERRGKYVRDRGVDLYRRSLYTFWKRTCPPPAMMSFDAPNREVCLARRARTNTPLQALILLNDPTYVEAARKLAERMIIDGGNDARNRLSIGFRRCVARPPSQEEFTIADQMLSRAQNYFANDPRATEQLLSVGESSLDKSIKRSDLAAWTMVASMLLNLDETITKR